MSTEWDELKAKEQANIKANIPRSEIDELRERVNQLEIVVGYLKHKI